MTEHGIVCSLSRAGNVWDNAAMESFFSTIKTERTAGKVYRTRDAARADVFDNIERFYNPRRWISTLGYLSPVAFEERQRSAQLSVRRSGGSSIHPAMAVAYRQRVGALAEALYDEELGRQAFERLRAVVEAVVLTPVDGQLAVELRGELAGILSVARKSDHAADIARKNAMQIKVVAGAGFDRELICRC